MYSNTFWKYVLPGAKYNDKALTAIDERLAKLAIKKRLMKFLAAQAWTDRNWRQ